MKTSTFLKTTSQVPAESQFNGTAAAAGKLSVAEDRNIATLAHFGGVLGCIPSAVIYYLYKGRAPFAQQEAREALNFTLLPTIIALASFFLSSLPGIGWIFGLVAALVWVILASMSLYAGIRVNRGNPYQYPLNTRLFDVIRVRR
ncbi:DUF4870 domain-containing protein [Rothia sp. ZJ1223]|nr:DUF4870 domain-containing protein [Rothia sp. ZJ1223]